MKKGLIFIVLFVVFVQESYSQNALNETHNLMPWPKHIEVDNSKYLIDSNLTISINENNPGRVSRAAVNFLRRLSNRTGVFFNTGFSLNNEPASIEISFDKISSLSIEEDESYTLEIRNKKISIKAKTDVGALYGLQTLLQSVTYDQEGYYFPGLTVHDDPRFVWRGLMIDVARHFQPIAVLKRNLDAMASVKLNVFHWHLTDDQGFRVESKIFPKLHQKASDGLYYTQEQVKDLIDYASGLGIRVVPEFDVPGHASAILTAYPEIGSKIGYDYSIERYAGVFDPTLDPTNEKTYEFLNTLFEEMALLFPDQYFHIGGDENEGKHWTENKKIKRFKRKHKLETNHDLQTYFNIRLEKHLNSLGKKLMGWDEIMTKNMPKTAVIHSWRGENEGLPKGGSLIKAAKAGYKTVLSNGFYIDRMLSVEHHYKTEPIGDLELTKAERSNILGGEATMWSELVTPLTIDSRIWPRTAAIAERFWSQKEVTDIDNMLLRLRDVNNNLEELGLTHIKNRDVILRSMARYQDISSLITLSKICEPLKVYSRNKGGTEYKSFSPFALFADACTADAQDARTFNTAIKSYLENQDATKLTLIKTYLNKWATNYEELMFIAESPNVKPLIPLSKNLSRTSKILSSVLESKNITNEELNLLDECINALKEPYVDVELAIVNSLSDLVSYAKKFL